MSRRTNRRFYLPLRGRSHNKPLHLAFNSLLLATLLLSLFPPLQEVEQAQAKAASTPSVISRYNSPTLSPDTTVYPDPPAPETRTVPPAPDQQQASLVLHIELSSQEIAVGETVTATVTILNQADAPANSLDVRLPTPTGAAAVDNSGATPGGFVSSTEGWHWTGGHIDAGSKVTFQAFFAVTTLPPGEALVVGSSATAQGLTLPVQEVGGALVVAAPNAMGSANSERTTAASSVVPVGVGPQLHPKSNSSTTFVPGQSKPTTLKSADGKLELTFPAGAYSKGLKLEHKPLVNKLPELQALGAAGLTATPTERVRGRRGLGSFFLEATETGLGGGGVPGKAVHQFDQPVTVSISYTPQQLRALGLSEANLTLFWWDEDTYEQVVGPVGELINAPQKGHWVAVPTAVDPGSRKVTATLDHFSGYQLSDGSSPSERYLPTLQGWQVSSYTGAASYSYPLEVPPGPGGVGPSLGLSYSSAATDGKSGLRQRQQAGWVGKGWSLDIPSISLNKARTGDYYSISMGGASFDLFDGYLIAGSNPRQWEFRPTDQTFSRIRKVETGLSYDANGSTPGRGGRNGTSFAKRTKWQVWTKDGSYYEFAEDAWQDWEDSCGLEPIIQDYAYTETYKWQLSSMQDTHGNVVTYNYDRKTAPIVACFGLVATSDVDIWPSSITWGGTGTPASDRFKVEFLSSVRTNDTQAEDLSNQLGEPNQTRQLDRVNVYSRQATTWDLIHQYRLYYDYSNLTDGLISGSGGYVADTTFPKLTLTGVQRIGWDGSTSLPTTQFTYGHFSGPQPGYYPPGNFNRLIKMDNGQGGEQTLAYENIGAVVGYGVTFQNYHRVTSRTATAQAASGVGLPARSYTTQYQYGTPSVNSRGTTLQPSAAVPQSYPNSAAAYLNNQQDSTPSVQTTNRQKLAHPVYSEFRGHDWTIEIAPDGQQVKHFFLQGEAYDVSTGTLTRCVPSTGTSFGEVPLNWSRYYADACWVPLRNGEVLKGKEYKTENYTNTGVLIGQSDHKFGVVFDDTYKTDYGNTPISGLWSAFSYEKEASTTIWNLERTLSQTLRTVNYYDSTYQDGGGFYGNLSRTDQFDAAGNLYRKTENYFRTNVVEGGTFIVAKPWQERISDGTGKVIGLTHLFYDGYTANPWLGSKGEATLSRKYYDLYPYSSLNGVVLHGIDSTMGYDTYGNPTSSTTYTGPGTGQYTAASNSWSFGAAGGGTAATTTTTTYDALFHLYPTRTDPPSVNGRTLSTQAGYDYRLGLLTSVTDANGAVTANEYDLFGRVYKQIKPGDSSAYPSTQTYYYDWEQPFRYLVTYRPTAGTGNYKGVQTIYDGLGRTLQTKTQSQFWTQNIVVNTDFDPQGRAYRTSQPRFVNETTSDTFWKYDPPVADNVMNWTVTAYNPLSQPATVTTPDGKSTQHNYGLLNDTADTGQVLAWHDVMDANQHRSQQRTNAFGQLLRVLEFSGECGNISAGLSYTCGTGQTNWGVYSTTKYAYNTLGQMTTLTDNSTNVTSLAYDNLGRKLSMQDPDMGRWSYNYDNNSNLTSQTDAKGQITSFVYDVLGRLIKKTTPAIQGAALLDEFDTRSTTNWTFSPGGEQTAPFLTPNDANVLKNSGTGATSGAWNAHFYRNSYSLSTGQSATVRFQTDATSSNGLLALESNGTTPQRFALRIHGATGKLMAQTSTDNVNFPTVDLTTGPFSFQANTWYVLNLSLNDAGTFGLEVYQENNPTVRGSFSQAMGAGRQWRFHGYQLDGYSLLSYYRENGASDVSQYFYERLSDGTTYPANGLGRMVESSNVNLNVRNTYDNRGRTTALTYAGLAATTRTFRWTYDSGDRISTFQMPDKNTPTSDGEILSYDYNDLWQAKALRTNVSGLSASGYFVNNATYNALGQPLQRSVGNAAIVDKWEYDTPLSRLSALKVGTAANPTSLLERYYTYDNVGNIASIGDSRANQTQNFKYDYLDRLKQAYTSGAGTVPSTYDETYAYDVLGNITAKGPTATPTSYTYPAAGSARPHTPTAVGGQAYSYDANGNLTSGGGRTISWDGANMPASVLGPDGVREYYAYGPGGERVKRTRGNTTTLYLGAWEEDIDATTGALVERKVQYKFGGSVIMQWSSVSSITYLHGDQLGSVSLATDNNGTAIGTPQAFDPWGKLRSGSSSITRTTLSYTGQKLDGTGLLFYNARYYDPGIARFVSSDTVVSSPGNSQSLNRYSYTHNNPIGFTDPSGHCDKGLTAEEKATDPCYQKANEAYHNIHYGGNLSALQQLDINKLNNLIRWMNRNINFTGVNWNGAAIDSIMQALDRIYNALYRYFGAGRIDGALTRLLTPSPAGLTFRLDARDELGLTTPGNNTISLNDKQYRKTESAANQQTDEQLIEGVIHEIGHIIDGNFRPGGAGGRAAGTFWSDSDPARVWIRDTGAERCVAGSPDCSDARWRIPGDVAAAYAKSSPPEDFAETFVWWVSNVNNNWRGSTSVRTNDGSRGPDGRVRPSQERRNMIDTVLGI